MTTVVDIHNHAIPDRFIERIRKEGASYGFSLTTLPNGKPAVITPDGEIESYGPQKGDEALRQDELRGVGIDVTVESGHPGMAVYTLSERQAEWATRNLNDTVAENVAAFPDRLSGMASVPLAYPSKAVRELVRAVEDLGMRSVQIATNINGENLDSPMLEPFWEAAEGLGVLVFVHPRYEIGMHRFERYNLRGTIGSPLEVSIALASIIFGGVLERYPRLAMCFALGGGFAPWIRGRWRHGHAARVLRHRPDPTPFDRSFETIYFDSVIHDPLALGFLIETVGPDRILHGTDYPSNMGTWQRNTLLAGSPHVAEADRAKMLGGNALRLIARDGQQTPGTAS